MSWFARLDRPIYLTDGRKPRNRGRRIVLTVAACAATTFGVALLPDGAFGVWAAVVVLVISVALISWYVVWRRRRNRRLTGSPTRWPDEDL